MKIHAAFNVYVVEYSTEKIMNAGAFMEGSNTIKNDEVKG